MNLKDLSPEMKAKGFDMILEAYKKDSNLSEFGKDVQEVIKFMQGFFK